MKEKLIKARAHLSEIPANMWRTGSFGSVGYPCCAEGHLGMKYSPQSGERKQLAGLRDAVFTALWTRFHMNTSGVNDGMHARFQQPTPKARILAALDECIAAEP